MAIEPGTPAPDLALPRHDGEMVRLGELYAGGPTVLLFFPLAFTRTCTEELCSVRDDLAAYTGVGAQVVALSVDSPYALARFRHEIGAQYDFLSDFNREAARAFGVLREGPLGPGLRGVSDRSAFVVDRGGAVRYAWHSPDPGALPPFAELRAAVAPLAG